MTKKLFDCGKCVAWCCTYDNIPVEPADVTRLAKHFGLTEAAAKRKYVKRGDKDCPAVLRHTKDPLFETSCMFLDKEKRACTIYTARPKICRAFPSQTRCGYYEFLKFERANNEDPDFVAVT
jgi:uncharacterized protein